MGLSSRRCCCTASTTSTDAFNSYLLQQTPLLLEVRLGVARPLDPYALERRPLDRQREGGHGAAMRVAQRRRQRTGATTQAQVLQPDSTTIASIDWKS